MSARLMPLREKTWAFVGTPDASSFEVGRFSVSANVIVDAFGNGEVDVLGVAEQASTNVPGLYLVHPSAAGANLAIEVPGGPTVPLAASFANFTPVKMELDLVDQTYAYSVGTASSSGKFTPALMSTNLVVVIGGQYTAESRARGTCSATTS